MENDGCEKEQIQRRVNHLVYQVGRPINEICRNGGFGDSTFYKRRTEFGSMDVPDAHKLRQLERENATLQKLLS